MHIQLDSCSSAVVCVLDAHYTFLHHVRSFPGKSCKFTPLKQTSANTIASTTPCSRGYGLKNELTPAGKHLVTPVNRVRNRDENYTIACT
jgi:hypothetical protein